MRACAAVTKTRERGEGGSYDEEDEGKREEQMEQVKQTAGANGEEWVVSKRDLSQPSGVNIISATKPRLDDACGPVKANRRERCMSVLHWRIGANRVPGHTNAHT